MRNFFSRYRHSLRTVAALCAAAGAASAVADVSDVFFSITAVSGGNTGTFEVMTDDVFYNEGSDTWTWFGAGISIDDDVSGSAIATLNTALIVIVGDPQVNMTFNVSAGAADTNFFVSTGTLSFPTLNNPNANASVGFTLTDSDPFGAGDGEADVTGTGPGGDTFVADYNLPGGTIFTQQMQQLSITGDPSGSTNFSVTVPPAGMSVIPGAVSSIRAYNSFTLSAYDQASSTSQFTVVPEPAAALCMLVVGFAALRRR